MQWIGSCCLYPVAKQPPGPQRCNTQGMSVAPLPITRLGKGRCRISSNCTGIARAFHGRTVRDGFHRERDHRARLPVRSCLGSHTSCQGEDATGPGNEDKAVQAPFHLHPQYERFAASVHRIKAYLLVQPYARTTSELGTPPNVQRPPEPWNITFESAPPAPLRI